MWPCRPWRGRPARRRSWSRRWARRAWTSPPARRPLEGGRWRPGARPEWVRGRGGGGVGVRGWGGGAVGRMLGGGLLYGPPATPEVTSPAIVQEACGGLIEAPAMVIVPAPAAAVTTPVPDGQLVVILGA